MGWVTITHPHHPLCGQQVEVVRIRRGADPDLIVRFPDGLHAAIAMSLTDYAASPEHDPPPARMHLLDFNGLRQIIQFIAEHHLRTDLYLPQILALLGDRALDLIQEEDRALFARALESQITG